MPEKELAVGVDGGGAVAGSQASGRREAEEERQRWPPV
jgi:hypothetical protein